MLRRRAADEVRVPAHASASPATPPLPCRRGRFVSGGGDPLALVVSLNVKRRNLTASQRAVAAAEAASNFGQSGREAARVFGVSKTYVANAFALVTRAPDLAESVKAGSMPLAEAFDYRRPDP